MVAEDKNNPRLRELIRELRAKGDGKKGPVWRAVARKLDTPRHKARPINVGHLERVAKAREVIVIPSKLLAEGDLTKPLTVVALGWSEEAGRKVLAAGGELKSLSDMLHENPKGTGVRLIG
jgi:large subunit ribosomal protein L18e